MPSDAAGAGLESTIEPGNTEVAFFDGREEATYRKQLDRSKKHFDSLADDSGHFSSSRPASTDFLALRNGGDGWMPTEFFFVYYFPPLARGKGRGEKEVPADDSAFIIHALIF